MATNDRASSLVQRVIAHLKRRLDASTKTPKPALAVRGASAIALDKLESRLMVELPPSLRTFLQFDYTFASLGSRFHGRGRFGQNPESPRPRMTSVRKLAEAKTEARLDGLARPRQGRRRLPNLPGQPWNALYLGEARRDGELLILGPRERGHPRPGLPPLHRVRPLPLQNQVGLLRLNEAQRLEDLGVPHRAQPPSCRGRPRKRKEAEGDY